MPVITKEQINDLFDILNTVDMTSNKCKEIMGLGGPPAFPPPMLSLELESVKKLLSIKAKMQHNDYSTVIPGAPKGILGVVEENLNKILPNLLKSKSLAGEDITNTSGLSLAISKSLLAQQFSEENAKIMQTLEINLPPLIHSLADSGQLDSLAEIEKKVRLHKNTAEGLTQLNTLVEKLTEENASLAIQQELEKDQSIIETLENIDALKKEFVETHTRLEGDIKEKIIDQDDIESSPPYKRLQAILKERTNYDSAFSQVKRKVKFIQRSKDESSQKQTTEKTALLKKIEELTKLHTELSLRLQEGGSNDSGLILSKKINLSIAEEQLLELNTRLEELNKQEAIHEKTDEELIHKKGEDKLTTLTLKSQKYMSMQLKALERESARQELLFNRFKEPTQDKAEHGVAKTGRLAIQIKLKDKNSPKASKKEQDSFIGLMMQQGTQRPRLVVPDKVNTAILSTLNIDIIKESELNEWRTQNSNSTPSVCLEALTQSQLERLAAFCGPDFSIFFDPQKPGDVLELYQVLRTKLGRSSVTMSDVLLVALGYRHRSESFLSDYLKNTREGFLFNPDTVTNGNDFFSSQLTLKHKDGKEDDRFYLDAVDSRPRADGEILAKLNADSHALEMDELYKAIDSETEKLNLALNEMLGVVDGNEEHPDYKKSVAAQTDIIEQFPKLHHQHNLCQFLLNNPDIYNPNIALELSALFAESIINLNHAKSITSLLAKETTNVENAIAAILKAQEAAAQELLSGNEQERLLKEIRDNLKTVMLGNVDAAEIPTQTEMLDKMAQLQYEATYGKPQSAEDKIAGQQENIQVAIGDIQSQIANEKVRGTVEGLERLQQELADLNDKNAQLERELMALKQLQEQAKIPIKEDGRDIDELEAENMALKQELAQAKIENDGPKSLAEAYNRNNSIDELIDYARRSNSGKLDPTLIFTQYVKPNTKGSQRAAKLKETKAKISTYNSRL